MRVPQPGWVYMLGPSANCSLLPASLFALLEVSTTTAEPETSFNMQSPEPGPHPEGVTAQRVHIKSCLLEDATIGNSNKMTIRPRSKGGDSEEPKEDLGEPRHECLCVPRPHPFILPSSIEAWCKNTRDWSSGGRTKSQRVAPGCREDIGRDKVIKSHRRALRRTEAEAFWTQSQRTARSPTHGELELAWRNQDICMSGGYSIPMVKCCMVHTVRTGHGCHGSQTPGPGKETFRELAWLLPERKL